MKKRRLEIPTSKRILLKTIKEDMKCSGYAKNITSTLKLIKCINHIEVSLGRKNEIAHSNSKYTDESKIRKAIKKCTYTSLGSK